MDIVPAYNPAAMEPAGGNQDIMPPDIVPAYIKRADRGQSCTSKVLATNFASERKHRDVKFIPWPNPEGTGTTDDATVPKQKGNNAKEKKDTKRTAKTVQKKPAGKATKKVKVQTAGSPAPTMKAMKVKVMRAMNARKGMKAMKLETEEEAWIRSVANDPSSDVATTEEGESVSEVEVVV